MHIQINTLNLKLVYAARTLNTQICVRVLCVFFFIFFVLIYWFFYLFFVRQIRHHADIR